MKKSPKVVGEKHDAGKSFRFHLFPLDAVREVGKVLTLGAEKYTEDGWQHVEDGGTRYYDAAIRHLAAWREGEAWDEGDGGLGTHHLANAACCVLFALALDLRRIRREAP